MILWGLVRFTISSWQWSIRKKEGIDSVTASNDPETVHYLFQAAAKWWWVYLAFLLLGVFVFQKLHMFKIIKLF